MCENKHLYEVLAPCSVLAEQEWAIPWRNFVTSKTLLIFIEISYVVHLRKNVHSCTVFFS